MSEPGLRCWVLAQSLAWSRGSQTPLARIPVLGARRICHLPAASFWAAHITSWSLLWEADWWGSWKDDIISVSVVWSAAKTAGIFLGDA